MAQRQPRRRYFDELFNEHIEMPGTIGLIVTRHDAWQFLKSIGYAECFRPGLPGGMFATCDYMVMRKPAVDLPCDPPDVRDRWFTVMRNDEATA